MFLLINMFSFGKMEKSYVRKFLKIGVIGFDPRALPLKHGCVCANRLVIQPGGFTLIIWFRRLPSKLPFSFIWYLVGNTCMEMQNCYELMVYYYLVYWHLEVQNKLDYNNEPMV